jgi:hypothetical protein
MSLNIMLILGNGRNFHRLESLCHLLCPSL